MGRATLRRGGVLRKYPMRFVNEATRAFVMHSGSVEYEGRHRGYLLPAGGFSRTMATDAIPVNAQIPNWGFVEAPLLETQEYKRIRKDSAPLSASAFDLSQFGIPDVRLVSRRGYFQRAEVKLLCAGALGLCLSALLRYTAVRTSRRQIPKNPPNTITAG
jgi:hypothetical protein